MKKLSFLPFLLVLVGLISCDKETNRNETDQATIYISGKITCQNGEPLAGAKITVNTDNGVLQRDFFTDVEGHYEIDSLEVGNDYTFQIDYTDDIINDQADVAAYGALLVERPTIDAFTQIAGDINRSGTITAIDKVQLEQKIDNKESLNWRIVPAELVYIVESQEFIFPNEFTQTLSLPNYDGTLIEQDFVGVKVGDLDKSICD